MKTKRTWAMPNKVKGIGSNLAGARIVSPMGDGISTDSRGQKYVRLPSGEIRKQLK